MIEPTSLRVHEVESPGRTSEQLEGCCERRFAPPPALMAWCINNPGLLQRPRVRQEPVVSASGRGPRNALLGEPGPGQSNAQREGLRLLAWARPRRSESRPQKEVTTIADDDAAVEMTRLATIRTKREDAPDLVTEVTRRERELVDAHRRVTREQLGQGFRHAVTPIFAGIVGSPAKGD